MEVPPPAQLKKMMEGVGGAGAGEASGAAAAGGAAAAADGAGAGGAASALVSAFSRMRLFRAMTFCCFYYRGFIPDKNLLKKYF